MAEPLGYRIFIERKAEKEAEKIPPPQRHRIDKAIISLSDDPRPHDCENLRIRKVIVSESATTAFFTRLMMKQGPWLSTVSR